MGSGFGGIAVAHSRRVDRAVKKGRRPAKGQIGEKQKKASDPSAIRLRIEQTIRAIPRGKVSTYGAIARAAGFQGAARQVAAVLRRSFGLPWQRVLGAGGEIKLRRDGGIEQRLRLEAEGVRFRGRRADMKAHEHKFLLAKRKHPTNRRPRQKRTS
jgi:methylated-DNA-protein-cysteine methyltransferase-like protein